MHILSFYKSPLGNDDKLRCHFFVRLRWYELRLPHHCKYQVNTFTSSLISSTLLKSLTLRDTLGVSLDCFYWKMYVWMELSRRRHWSVPVGVGECQDEEWVWYKSCYIKPWNCECITVRLAVLAEGRWDLIPQAKKWWVWSANTKRWKDDWKMYAVPLTWWHDWEENKDYAQLTLKLKSPAK